MIIARRILTKAGAYLARRAEKLARSLFKQDGRFSSKYEIVDGFILRGTRAGDRGSATVMDLPIPLIIPYMSFTATPSGSGWYHDDNATPIPPLDGIPSPPGSEFPFQGNADKFAATTTLVKGRDSFLEGGGLSTLTPADYESGETAYNSASLAYDPTMYEGALNYAELLRGRPIYEPETLHFFGTSSCYPLAPGVAMVADIHVAYSNELAPESIPWNADEDAPNYVPARQATAVSWWNTDYLYGGMVDENWYYPPVSVNIRVRLLYPELDEAQYGSSQRVVGFTLPESYFQGLGYPLATRQLYGGGPSFSSSEIRGFFPGDLVTAFEMQQQPWVVAAPFYRSLRSGFSGVLVTPIVLEQKPNRVDGFGVRGLAVTTYNGAYDEELERTVYQFSTEIVEPPSGAQYPMLRQFTNASPWLDQYTVNGYQPSILATFRDGTVLAIHRHFSVHYDVTTSVRDFPDDYAYGTERYRTAEDPNPVQRVHVSAQLVTPGGVTGGVDLVGPAAVYSPSPSDSRVALYDGLIGADTDGENTAVAIALGFYPGWLAFIPSIGTSDPTTPESQDDPHWNPEDFETIGGNDLYTPGYGYMHTPSSSDPRVLVITTFSRDGGFTASTQVVSVALYPLAEAWTQVDRLGVRLRLLGGQIFLPWLHQRDTIPSTTEGVTYIGNGKYVFLAALDVAGGRRVAVIYNQLENATTVGGEIFDALSFPVRTAAGRILCIKRESGSVDGGNFQPATLISPHSDVGQGRWPEPWQDATAGQNDESGHRPGGEYGFTAISYDSGMTWDVLTSVGGYPGVAPGVSATGYYQCDEVREPPPEEIE